MHSLTYSHTLIRNYKETYKHTSIHAYKQVGAEINSHSLTNTLERTLTYYPARLYAYMVTEKSSKPSFELVLETNPFQVLFYTTQEKLRTIFMFCVFFNMRYFTAENIKVQLF